MCLFLTLTTAGCAPGGGAGDNLALTPVVVDLTATRCVQPDAAARREATLTVQAPKPDATTADGRPAVSKGALKSKADEMRAAITRKNGVIRRLIEASDRCVDGDLSASAATS